MTTDTKIPPSRVEAEPSTSARTFRKRPAMGVMLGDLLFLRGKEWRVKSVGTVMIDGREFVSFQLWPVAGGRPENRRFRPNEWIPACTEVKP